MKRIGDLWPRLIDFPNLLDAAGKAARGKRRRPNVARFHFRLEPNLLGLQAELGGGSYRPGPYYQFEIYQPKRRLISAAPYRDRVVHHALCNVLEPVFEPVFIADSYACRKGKGTHRALDRFSELARRYPYVLKCDVSRYFPSIDHAILKQLIRRKIKDAEVLWLVDLIIDGSNAQEPVTEWFPGDDLLSPLERRKGLPIGNQTSQFFSNVYLDPFDHFVKETLRVRAYCRYCDDFALFAEDPRELADWREACRERLAALRLRLHPRKSVIYRTQDGPRFLGFRVFPTHRLLAKENVTRMRRRLVRMQRDYAAGRLTPAEVEQRLASWIGHASHGDTWRLREQLFADHPFVRGPA